jgi:hypothetical protein
LKCENKKCRRPLGTAAQVSAGVAEKPLDLAELPANKNTGAPQKLRLCRGFF